MNVNPLIISGLSSLGLPVAPDAYTGTATEYIVFNYADERPEMYADDEDRYDATFIQVHYFTKSDPHTTKKAIRRLARAAGFTVTNTQQLYEDDTGYVHVIVECWIDGFIDD
jgi:hypothetical protein